MKPLFSNFSPVDQTGFNSFKKYFLDTFAQSDEMVIASGYISADSVTEIKRLTEDNNKNRLELIIGMHHFEGFSPAQYQAIRFLDEFLQDTDSGRVYVCRSFKFHGKIYQFKSKGKVKSTVIGSSNLHSAVLRNTRIYEADVCSEDENFGKGLSSFLAQLTDKSAKPFSDYKKGEAKIIIQKKRLLADRDNVTGEHIKEFQRLYKLSKDLPAFGLNPRHDCATSLFVRVTM